MGSGVSTPKLAEQILTAPLDGSDLTSPSQAIDEVKKLRSLFISNNNTRVARLLCLSKDDLETHHQAVLTAVAKRENERKKIMIEEEKRGDYSKSFSGTADDTKNEAEAASLLKVGGPGAGEEDSSDDSTGEYAILRPFKRNVPTSALAALEEKGKWMKYLNMNGCFGYVHGLTLEARGNRPDSFVDPSEKEKADAEAEAAKKKKEEVRTIAPKEIKEVLDEVEEMRGKTLLLLTDGEHDEALRTFFTMHGVVCDLSALGQSLSEQRKKGTKVKQVLEECRKSIVQALQRGATLAIFIGDIDGDDMPILEKLCQKPLGGPKKFPSQLFENKGKGLFDKHGGSKLKLNLLFSDDETDAAGGCMFSVKFQTCIISSSGKKSYKRQLKSCFPLDNFVIVAVE
mgnify:CR=1 FL=1